MSIKGHAAEILGLEFLIEEIIFYTGRLSVRRGEVEDWLVTQELASADLTPQLLQSFADEKGYEPQERHADVQGQQWREFDGEKWAWSSTDEPAADVEAANRERSSER